MQQRVYQQVKKQTKASYAFSMFRGTKAWVSLETACLERDGYKCKRCRGTRAVTVWVKKWPENGGSYAGIGLEDVECLCPPCIRRARGQGMTEDNVTYNIRKRAVEDLGVVGAAPNGKEIRKVRTK